MGKLCDTNRKKRYNKKRDTIEKREDQLDMEDYKNANPEEKYKLRTL